MAHVYGSWSPRRAGGDGYSNVAGEHKIAVRMKEGGVARHGLLGKLSSNLTIGVSEHQSDLASHACEATSRESSMTQYCFALTSPRQSESRLRVGEFPSAERALQLAELIAFELGAEADGNWRDWTVEVRSSEGRRLFTVPVGAAAVDRLAATVSDKAIAAMSV